MSNIKNLYDLVLITLDMKMDVTVFKLHKKINKISSAKTRWWGR